MAPSARKSLAGSAAAVAKRVIAGGQTAVSEPAQGDPAESPPTGRSAPRVPRGRASGSAGSAAVEVPAPKTLERATVPAEGARQAGAKKAAPTAGRTAGKKSAAAKKPPAKRTAAKKAPGLLVVKEGEDPWTKGELDSVLHELHAHRARLVEMMETQEVELNGLMRDAGDGAGQDQADMGATSFERDHELTLMNSERVMLLQIDKALTRIDDHTYGMCESCGQAIGKMRVMAFPRATLCLPCKQREERR